MNGRPPGPRDENGDLVHGPCKAELALRKRGALKREVPITAADVEQATVLTETPEARRLLLAHMALGHGMQNPQTARSMGVRRAALHDLMIASGDIQEGGLRLQVQANTEGGGVQLVVIANGRGPAPPELEAQVVDQPSEPHVINSAKDSPGPHGSEDPGT